MDTFNLCHQLQRGTTALGAHSVIPSDAEIQGSPKIKQ
jgi:hypothetical protein